MTVGKKTKQLRKDNGLQQKVVAADAGLDQSNYNKVVNSKWEPSVEVLQKLSVIPGVTIDELLNPDDKKRPAPTTVEDKTVAEKIRLVKQLEEGDKNVMYKRLDTLPAKNKFQDFLQQNISVE